MRGDFASLASKQLQWLPDLGIGFLDIDPPPGFYGAEYFNHYTALDHTPMSARLNRARLAFVDRHWRSGVSLIDVGIGGGSFVLTAGGACKGWDINPFGQEWLIERHRLVDPRSTRVLAATFWDSIEHMRDPSEILRNVERWVFISTPTYTSANQARGSKHFKPGEHLWYFTERGLQFYMAEQGFRLRESNLMETDIGREGIGSFAFERA